MQRPSTSEIDDVEEELSKLGDGCEHARLSGCRFDLRCRYLVRDAQISADKGQVLGIRIPTVALGEMPEELLFANS